MGKQKKQKQKQKKTWFTDIELQKYFDKLTKQLPLGIRTAPIGTAKLNPKNKSVQLDKEEIHILNSKYCTKIFLPITQPGHISAILINMKSGNILYYDSQFQNSLPLPPQMLIIQDNLLPQLQSKFKFCDSLNLKFSLNTTPLSGSYR